jgi:hypothetical protein
MGFGIGLVALAFYLLVGGINDPEDAVKFSSASFVFFIAGCLLTFVGL